MESSLQQNIRFANGNNHFPRSSFSTGCWEHMMCQTYLFVRSWVGLPEALHLSEREVGTVRQAAKEGARGSLWKHLIRLLFHTGIFTAAFTDLQWTSLQFIVKLESIDC